jgi:hypothetical protein
LKYFAGEHYSLDEFERIEWIDDTSANIIYSTANAAHEALLALTNTVVLNMDASSIPPLQLRPSKGLSMRPEAELYIRQATTIDVKKKGAHEASRYYLLNPDKDPRERKRQQDPRGGRGGRGTDGHGEFNRRQFDDYEHKRRREDAAANGFDADMYDDDGGSGSNQQPSDYDRRKRVRTRRSQEDLFAGRLGKGSGGRLRGRSASPAGDGDGRLGFGEESNGNRARRTRQRSRSPRAPSKTTTTTDLFPLVASPSQPRNAPKELFPTLASPNGMRSVELAPPSPVETRLNRNSLELFPNKRGSFSHHRRTAAFDSTPGRERSLAERITGRPSTAPSDEIRVRGAAENGISIRGMANYQAPSVRELFPLKAGNNAGKELFGEKIKGRGGPRRKAEDMF